MSSVRLLHPGVGFSLPSLASIPGRLVSRPDTGGAFRALARELLRRRALRPVDWRPAMGADGFIALGLGRLLGAESHAPQPHVGLHIWDAGHASFTCVIGEPDGVDFGAFQRLIPSRRDVHRWVFRRATAAWSVWGPTFDLDWAGRYYEYRAEIAEEDGGEEGEDPAIAAARADAITQDRRAAKDCLSRSQRLMARGGCGDVSRLPHEAQVVVAVTRALHRSGRIAAAALRAAARVGDPVDQYGLDSPMWSLLVMDERGYVTAAFDAEAEYMYEVERAAAVTLVFNPTSPAQVRRAFAAIAALGRHRAVCRRWLQAMRAAESASRERAVRRCASRAARAQAA